MAHLYIYIYIYAYLEFKNKCVTWRALYAPCACVVPREHRVHARVLRNRAPELETLDVRLPWCARGYSHHAHHALLRSLYRSASRQRFSFFSTHGTLPVLGFVPLRLCASSLLCAFVPQLFSELCSSGFVSASALPLVSTSPLLHSPLLLHSSLLCIRSSSETLKNTYTVY